MRSASERARPIGWLFVLATAAGVLSVAALSPSLGDDDLLAGVHAHQGSLILGEMLVFVMLVAMVGTAVLLAPVLREHSETSASSYVLARAFEVVVIAIGMVAGLLLIPLSWDAAPDDGNAVVVADTLKAASDWTGYLGAQMVFSISALVLNLAFFRSRLLPRWLTIWGLAGVPLMFLSGLLVMFESLNDHSGALNLLVVPLAVQEMAMAVWMIVRGFDAADEPEPVSEAPPHLAASR